MLSPFFSRLPLPIFKLIQSQDSAFFPIPGIDSVLVQLDRLEAPFLFDQEDRALIRKIFTQRRKQIGSLIKKESTDVKEKIDRWLLANKLDRHLRPEQISAINWQQLAAEPKQ